MKELSLIVYGIRHHGPGSAKRLQKALRQQDPDCMLIEAPEDISACLSFIDDTTLQPPVAVLAYYPKDLSKAAYLPFAKFSPEYQAARYALQHKIELRAIDLPLGISLFSTFKEQKSTSKDVIGAKPWILDPLGYLAKVAGYDDVERWWEATFEEEDDDLRLFRAIIDLMRALRTEVGAIGQSDNLIREAFMRKQIRKAIKDGFTNIAVVCGAWHAPVLHDYVHFSVRQDNQQLKGLKKTALKSTWIPWSYERLAKGGGYGAGVVSPAWYDLVFNKRSETSIRFMIKAARLLRKEQLDVSVAHVEEAVRLANSLSVMRGRRLAGIDELEEAVISVFLQGKEKGMDLIRRMLILGDVVGRVPKTIPQLPIQKDLGQAVKSARLSKEFESSETLSKDLDLRKPANLLGSQLLHRLLILGIPWGSLKDRRKQEQGRFKERWTLKWRPDYAVRVIEAGMYGKTVKEAASVYVGLRIKEMRDLKSLTVLLDQVLKGDLRASVTDLLQALGKGAAIQKDLSELIRSVVELIAIYRYGTNYETDEKAIANLIKEIIPRICSGMPLFASQLNDDMARSLFLQMRELQGAIHSFKSVDLIEQWQGLLHRLIGMNQVHPTIRGWCTRGLLDQKRIISSEARQRMNQALSVMLPPKVQVEWLEGFLQGSGLLLIHQPLLWQLINAWVEKLDKETFEEVLPVLRRAFSNFPERERELILNQIKKGPEVMQNQTINDQYDPELVAILLPGIHQLLGK